MAVDHFESRLVKALQEAGLQTRPDCVIHSHISVANLCVHNGKICSIENEYIKNAQTMCDMIYKNELYNGMSKEFGLVFKRELVEPEKYQGKRSKESFRFRIDGITDEVRNVHATRSQELKKECEKYIATKVIEEEAKYQAKGEKVPSSVYNMKISPETEKEISRGMRSKKLGMTQKEMVGRWETEYDLKGFTHDKLTEIMSKGRSMFADRYDKAPSGEELIALLSQKKQGWIKKDFRDLYLQHHAGTGKSFEQLRDEISGALKDHAVELKADKSINKRELVGEDNNKVFTSRALHEAEMRSVV
jgi:hypothetical protein